MPFYKRYRRRRSYRPRARKGYRRRTFRRGRYRRRRYYRRSRKSDTVTGWFSYRQDDRPMQGVNTNGFIYAFSPALSSFPGGSRALALADLYRQYRFHKVLVKAECQGSGPGGGNDYGPMIVRGAPDTMGPSLCWNKWCTCPDADGVAPVSRAAMLQSKGAKVVDIIPGRKMSRMWRCHALAPLYRDIVNWSYAPRNGWVWTQYPGVVWYAGYHMISNENGTVDWTACDLTINVYVKISFRKLKNTMPFKALITPP